MLLIFAFVDMIIRKCSF